MAGNLTSNGTLTNIRLRWACQSCTVRERVASEWRTFIVPFMVMKGAIQSEEDTCDSNEAGSPWNLPQPGEESIESLFKLRTTLCNDTPAHSTGSTPRDTSLVVDCVRYCSFWTAGGQVDQCFFRLCWAQQTRIVGNCQECSVITTLEDSVGGTRNEFIWLYRWSRSSVSAQSSYPDWDRAQVHLDRWMGDA
jgi:hypothetical protein